MDEAELKDIEAQTELQYRIEIKDGYAVTTIRQLISEVRRLKAENERPKLPRVSPENLVEGERYLVRYGNLEFIGVYEIRNYCPIFLNFPTQIDARLTDDIAGPLPHFEIGEQ